MRILKTIKGYPIPGKGAFPSEAVRIFSQLLSRLQTDTEGNQDYLSNSLRRGDGQRASTQGSSFGGRRHEALFSSTQLLFAAQAAATNPFKNEHTI